MLNTKWVVGTDFLIGCIWQIFGGIKSSQPTPLPFAPMVITTYSNVGTWTYLRYLYTIYILNITIQSISTIVAIGISDHKAWDNK